MPHARRAAALTAVVAVLLATPVAAQGKPLSQDYPRAAAASGYAVPPPLPPGTPPPADTGVPDLDNYRVATHCARSLDQAVQPAYVPWGQQRLRVAEAHRYATGAGQTVAVIDTGVRAHPYLGGRLRAGGDYIKTADHGLKDCDGHGTEVAGIIAAKTPHGVGFTGVAPDARILSIRQSSGIYVGTPKPTRDDPKPADVYAGNLATLAMAVRRAADAGATVINMSVDNCRPAGPITAQERTLQAALNYAVEKKNAVLVASAGNTNQNKCPAQNNSPDPARPATIVTPPWFADDVISVAAVRADGTPADFSVQGPWVTVAAPGTDIISLDPATDGLANQTVINGVRTPIQGTSFAAPYVSGLAALIRQRYPKLTAHEVMARIEQTARHPAGGRNTGVGYGLIDPVAALTARLPAADRVTMNSANATAGFGHRPAPATSGRGWPAPQVAALLTIAGGLGLLLMTLLTVQAMRRNRRLRPAGSRRS